MSPSIADILAAVASWYGITTLDLRSSRRARAVSRPRQVAMYLAKTLTPRSYPAIGRAMGRDHTTVMYGVDQIAALSLEDPSILAAVAGIRRQLAPQYTAARWPATRP